MNLNQQEPEDSGFNFGASEEKKPEEPAAAFNFGSTENNSFDFFGASNSEPPKPESSQQFDSYFDPFADMPE